MKLTTRLHNLKLHTQILWVVLGLIVVAGVVMIVRQATGHTVDQQRNKVNVSFIGTTGDKSPSIELEVADTEYKWEYGLMFRWQMNRGDGMIFVFPDEQVRNFWMKNTYIPLDMIFVDAQGRIVSIAPWAKPLDETPISSIYPAKYVIEVSSGWSAQAWLHTGVSIDTLAIDSYH